jgi:ABC-type proline/glycine betaine transport system substrate-binding protein
MKKRLILVAVVAAAVLADAPAGEGPGASVEYCVLVYWSSATDKMKVTTVAHELYDYKRAEAIALSAASTKVVRSHRGSTRRGAA